MEDETFDMRYDPTHQFGTEQPREMNRAGASQRQDSTLPPNALVVYWELYSRTEQWTSALTIAEGIVAAAPELPIGWVYLSFALQRLGRVRQALKVALEGAERYPDDWRIAYNLGCYSCQLGDVALAWDWIDRAIELGNADVIKSAALDDPNLRPLWARLGRI